VTREEDIQAMVQKGGRVYICRYTIIIDANHRGDAGLLSICSQDTSKVEQFMISTFALIENLLLGKASRISKRGTGLCLSSST
jgi:hypothetical protein